MPSVLNDAEALLRENEVRGLHPASTPKHLLAPLSTRILLRTLERASGEREMKVIGESYLTAVVDGGDILFYDGAGPVWVAATIPVAEIESVERDANPLDSGSILPTLHLSGRHDDEPYDLQFQVFEVVEQEIKRSVTIDDEVSWWQAATTTK